MSNEKEMTIEELNEFLDKINEEEGKFSSKDEEFSLSATWCDMMWAFAIYGMPTLIGVCVVLAIFFSTWIPIYYLVAVMAGIYFIQNCVFWLEWAIDKIRGTK